MDTSKSSVYRGEQDHHPHACTEGLVYLTYTVHDHEAGDEAEHIEAVPCRRCADEASEGPS